jgi:hypothetical protein
LFWEYSPAPHIPKLPLTTQEIRCFSAPSYSGLLARRNPLCGKSVILIVQSWLDHRDIKSTMVYLKGIRSKDAGRKVNSGELAELVA